MSDKFNPDKITTEEYDDSFGGGEGKEIEQGYEKENYKEENKDYRGEIDTEGIDYKIDVQRAKKGLLDKKRPRTYHKEPIKFVEKSYEDYDKEIEKVSSARESKRDSNSIKEKFGFELSDIDKMNPKYYDLDILAKHFSAVAEATKLHPQMVKEKKDNAEDEKYKKWHEARQIVENTGKSNFVNKFVLKYDLGRGLSSKQAEFLAQEIKKLRDTKEKVMGVVDNTERGKGRIIDPEITAEDMQNVPKNKKERKWWQFRKVKKAA